MQGTIVEDINGKLCVRATIIDENGNNTITDYEIPDGRLERIAKDSGITYQLGDTVEYKLNHTEHFPYLYAYPFVVNETGVYNTPSAELPVQKKVIKKKRVNLLYAGFPLDDDVVVCDGWDVSSNRYYYFYDKDKNRNSVYLKCCPIDRTIIDSIEEIEVEID